MNQNNKFDNFSIDWSNSNCSKLENIYDCYLVSKTNNVVMPYFSLKDMRHP